MRAFLIILLLLGLSFSSSQLLAQGSPDAATEIEKQKEANDVALALKQQREEAQDKLANAYIAIMRLQREVDQMRAQLKLPPYADQPAHKAPDAPPK